MPGSDDSDFLRAFSAELMDKARREIPRPHLSPATVISVASSQGVPYNGYADVHVDGDPPEAVAHIPTVIGDVIPNQRVMILWDPPHGAYIIGSAQGGLSSTPVGRISNSCPGGGGGGGGG